VALLVDAVSFLVIALLLATSAKLPRLEHTDYQPWHRRFRAGLSFARGHGTIKTFLIGQSLALICFTVVVPIEVIYAKESLGTTSAGFGVLLSAWGAGIVLGSLLFVGLKNRSGFLLIVISTALIGVAYLGMAKAGTLWFACVMSVVGGTGNGVQWVAVMTALLEATPPEFQARMSGLLESIGAAMPGVGYLLGGVLTQMGSPRTAFAFAGVGVLVLVVGALILRPAHEKRVRPRQQPARPSGVA
jgi:MFS family permease